MKDEQLKMVLEALTSLGDGAREAFFWWLLFDKALPVLGWLSFGAMATWVVHSLIKEVNK